MGDDNTKYKCIVKHQNTNKIGLYIMMDLLKKVSSVATPKILPLQSPAPATEGTSERQLCGVAEETLRMIQNASMAEHLNSQGGFARPSSNMYAH